MIRGDRLAVITAHAKKLQTGSELFNQPPQKELNVSSVASEAPARRNKLAQKNFCWRASTAGEITPADFKTKLASALLAGANRCQQSSIDLRAGCSGISARSRCTPHGDVLLHDSGTNEVRGDQCLTKYSARLVVQQRRMAITGS